MIQMSKAFCDIYDTGSWGHGSGPGSHPYFTIEYRAFLEKFIRMNAISSIADIGCGDWQFSQFLNLSGLSYVGYDVVSNLVATNQRRFGSPNVKFAEMPTDPSQVAPADLLLMKDVLQHLPDAMVFEYIRRVIPRFRFALLTNSFEKHGAHKNVDLNRPGQFRCLDLTAAPYKVEGAYVFEFYAQPWERIRALLVTSS